MFSFILDYFVKVSTLDAKTLEKISLPGRNCTRIVRGLSEPEFHESFICHTEDNVDIMLEVLPTSLAVMRDAQIQH